MASAEAPSASSLGPRYAPEDPTLPKPWKGLIDGSTGLLYYWNPETNITQYDKPVPMNPPLPPGPPPTASAPNIASVPVVGSLPSNVSAPEQQLKQNHPVAQQPQSVCQQIPALNSQQLPYHQTQPVNQQTQQQYSQLQSNQIHYPQVSYFQGPLMGQSPVQGSQVPYKQQGVSYVPYQQDSHFSFQQQPQQQGSEVSVQQQQQLQGSQVPFQQQHQQQHGPLASYQQQEQLQASKMPFQMGQQSQVSQTSHYQGKQPENQQIAAYQQGKQAQGQQIAANQQGQQIGFSRMEESLQQEGKQAGLSLPQVQLTGLGPSNHQLSGPVTQIQVSQGGFNSLEPQQQLFGGQSPSGQPFSSLSSRGQQFSGLSLGQQFNGPSSGAQQLSGPSSSGQHFRGLSSGGEQFSGQHVSISSVQFPQVGTDQSYQGQQMSSSIIPNQVGQSMARPMGLPIGNEEDQRGRLGNDFLPLSRNEGTMMPSQLPKLALLPQRWNAQDMRKGGVSPRFVSPANFGELNLAPGHRMPDHYNHPPFPNSAPMRPTQRMFGVPEFPAITAADTYRQHHEVTTMHVEVVPPEDKQQRLDQILRSHERGTKIIIFCSTKRQCDQLAHGIGRTFGAASIHGDKSQDERDHALNQFRCGKAPILVATDVAACGLDIKGIRVVINYDFPTAIQDYVHRIGRTERAGATGVSYTFFSHEDWKYAADLIKVLEGANQRVPPELHEMAARGGPPAFSRTLSHGSVSRWESGGGRWESGGGRGSGQWESDGGRSGGMRDFGGGRGFGGRGGSGGRNDFYGGRGSMRGRGIGGPSGYSRPGDRRRHDRGPRDRYYNHPDGQGRFDGATRREYRERGHDWSYSRSPGKVHSRGYDRGRKGSRSRSRSRSLSRSRSRRRPRSWSRSRSQIRSSSRSRSRSRSYDRYDRPRRKSLFSDSPALPEEVVGGEEAPRLEAPVVPGFVDVPPLSGDLSPMSPGQDNGPFPRKEKPNPVPVTEGSLAFAAPETGLEPGN